MVIFSEYDDFILVDIEDVRSAKAEDTRPDNIIYYQLCSANYDKNIVCLSNMKPKSSDKHAIVVYNCTRGSRSELSIDDIVAHQGDISAYDYYRDGVVIKGIYKILASMYYSL